MIMVVVLVSKWVGWKNGHENEREKKNANVLLKNCKTFCCVLLTNFVDLLMTRVSYSAPPQIR